LARGISSVVGCIESYQAPPTVVLLAPEVQFSIVLLT